MAKSDLKADEMEDRLGLRGVSIDIALTFARQFMGGLLQLGILLVIAQNLGGQGVGEFSVALILPTILAQLLNLGLPTANIYFVASRQVDPVRAWAATRNFVFPIAILGSGIAGAGLILGASDFFPQIDLSILLASLSILPSSLLTACVAGHFQALQKFRSFNLTVIAQPLVAIVFVVTFAWNDSLSVLIAIYCVGASHLIALIFALVILSRDINIFATGRQNGIYLKTALSYGWKSHLGNILSFLNYRIDLFLINFFLSPAIAGLYNVAVRLVEQLWLISQAFSTIILPRLSAMANDGEAKAVFTAAASRAVVAITLPAAILLAITADFLVKLLFGYEFSDSVPLVHILLPGVVFFSVARVLANDLAARGLVGINLKLALLVVVANTIMNLLLIPRLGAWGGAIATTLSYTITLIIRLYLQAHLTKIPFQEFIIPRKSDLAGLAFILLGKR